MAADELNSGSAVPLGQHVDGRQVGAQPHENTHSSENTGLNEDSELTGDTQPQIDMTKAAAMFEQLVQRQNLPLGIASGCVAAIVGAIAWAVVTNLTGYQIGWMAIGIGFLVGFAIRTFGQGLTRSFGIAGGALSLFGCLIGNLLAVCGMIAQESGSPIVMTTLSVLTDPPTILELFTVTFHPMDALFYVIAVYEGYKFSFREVSVEELQAMVS